MSWLSRQRLNHVVLCFLCGLSLYWFYNIMTIRSRFQHYNLGGYDEALFSQKIPLGKDDTYKSSDEGPSKPLNVLIFYPDDWRHDDIGGVAPVVRTPFLNRLASQGIRFTQNAVTTSICWISRATLFTGQYVSRHFSHHLLFPVFATHNWNTSWPFLLQQNGYFVGHSGKWQYADIDDYMGKIFNWSNFHEGDHFYDVQGERVAAADLSKMDVLRFFEERPKDVPFAMTVAYYPPKSASTSNEPGEQWFPKEEYKEMYKNDTIPFPYNMAESYEVLPDFLHDENMIGRGRWKERFVTEEHYQKGMQNYYALISHVDKACEQIVDQLEKDGILNETMIIFTTDNGLMHGEHGFAGKWFPYQESIRVPLIIYDPRMPEKKRGTLDDSFTLNIDLAKTILGAANVEPPPLMQGRDISDLYLHSHERKEYSPWRTEFYYEYPSFEALPLFPSSTAYVRKDWKYIHWPEVNYHQFFDLVEDPFELVDLAGELIEHDHNREENKKLYQDHPDKLQQLEERLAIFKEMRFKHDKSKIDIMEPVVPGSYCDPSTWDRKGIKKENIVDCMYAGVQYWNSKVSGH